MIKTEEAGPGENKNVLTGNNSLGVRASSKALPIVMLALASVSLFIFYAVDLVGEYPVTLLFELGYLFVAVAFFVIIFLFFFIDGFSLALALLVPYMIFIGGRIIVLLVTGDVEVFDYTYFTEYHPNSEEAVKLTIQAAVGFLSIAVGYLAVFFGLSHKEQMASTAIASHDLSRWGGLMLAVALPILGFELFDKINLVRSEGYAALYQDQARAYSGSLLSSGLTLLSLSLCFSLAGSNSLIRRITLLSYAFIYLILGIIGQRGPVFSLLILVVALLIDKKSINQKLIYMGLAIVGSLILMEVFSVFTLRDYSLDSRYDSSILNFLYEQGGTLSIYGISLDIIDYPLTAYVQNFVPGFAVVSNFIGYPVSADQLSFGAYLSKTLNENLYDLGQGLGWSLLGDAVQFFGSFYSLFLIVLGAAMGYVDSKKEESYFYFGLWILILAKISFLPRASVGSVLVPVTYYVIFWLAIYMYSRCGGFGSSRDLSHP